MKQLVLLRRRSDGEDMAQALRIQLANQIEFVVAAVCLAREQAKHHRIRLKECHWTVTEPKISFCQYGELAPGHLSHFQRSFLRPGIQGGRAEQNDSILHCR